MTVSDCNQKRLSRVFGLLVALSTAAPASASECVVLLHGLARTSSSLIVMEEALQEDGYRTANIDYPSREYEIADLSRMAVGAG